MPANAAAPATAVLSQIRRAGEDGFVDDGLEGEVGITQANRLIAMATLPMMATSAANIGSNSLFSG